MAPVDARKKLEQIRRKKSKINTNSRTGNVQDLRQLIAKKKKTKGNDRSPNKVSSARVIKTRSSSSGGQRDLRDTNKKLASRRRDNRSASRNDRVQDRSINRGPTRSVPSTTRKSSSNGGQSLSYKARKQVHPQQQYYVPPHLQQQQQQPTYIFAPAPAPQSNLAMDNVPETRGASILISNLMPSITQSDLIELFGEVGTLTAVNMINQTTALVTYQNSSDAVEAVKVYHNRELDQKPMFVNMMPNSVPSSNIRSRIGHAPVMNNHPAPMEISYGGRHI